MRTITQHEWRCEECGRLLGARRGGQLHIKVSTGVGKRGYDYLVSPPITAVCRGCKRRNELSSIHGRAE